MTSDQRKTLEAMAECEDGAAEEAEDFQGAIPLAEEHRRGAAAIRAALAEVDALTQQVADLEARAKDAAEAFESIDKCLAFSSRDHGLYRGDAWVYGIVCGWEHGDSKAMDEMAARHGWSGESVALLRRLHKAGVALSAAKEAP